MTRDVIYFHMDEKNMKYCKLCEAVEIRAISINPSAQPNKKWHLYSLPGFDDGKTVLTLMGNDILSNKFTVPDNCILLNKLNVRFRRIWEVRCEDENKICSTEFLPLIAKNGVSLDFIYYTLLTDTFTNHLANIHTNTSGSHNRVNPRFILDTNIALPDLSTQLRIAGVLTRCSYQPLTIRKGFVIASL